MNINSRDDQAFIDRLNVIVAANLNNELFGVNELSEKMGLSRSHIHRKLKSICNKSVSRFIREIRLEKAKEFLEEGNFTVSEIAYKVGFGSPSYFIKSFHDYFGYPPGEYVKYAPENLGKQEKATLPVEDKQKKEERKSYFKKAFTNKKVLPVLIVIGIIISGILISIATFRNQEIAVAVLPPENLTSQVDNEFLAYGVQAELIGELSELEGLRVISQRSALACRDTLMSFKDIARKLNVNMLILVGLTKAGDKMEIVLNLVDVFPNERNILTNKYEANMENIMQIFSSAVRDIAQKLHLNLTDDVKRRLNQQRKVNPESLKAYLRGMYILGKDNPELFDEGIRYMREAIDNDPGDPFAYAAISLGYAIKGHHSFSDKDFNNAEYYADRALELDPTIEEAFTAKAMLYSYQKWDWEKAEEAYTEILKRNPNNDVAHAHFAWYYVVHNNYEKAIYHAEKAVTLNPLYIEWNAWLACIYYRCEEYELAETFAKKVLAERDSSIYGNIVVGWVNLLQKKYPEAINYTEKLPTKPIYYELYRAYVYNKAGEREKALTYRDKMEERAKTRNVADWVRGLMAAIFGNKDEAFKYFNIAIDKKQYQMIYIDWYPFTEGLRNDPRYNELLKRMNLPPNNEDKMAVAR